MMALLLEFLASLSVAEKALIVEIAVVQVVILFLVYKVWQQSRREAEAGATLLAAVTRMLEGIRIPLEKIEPLLREEFERNRNEIGRNSRSAREEMAGSLHILGDSLLRQISDNLNHQRSSLNDFADTIDTFSRMNELKLDTFTQRMTERMQGFQTESLDQARTQRVELSTALEISSAAIARRMTEIAALQNDHFQQFAENLNSLTTKTETRLAALTEKVDAKLTELQERFETNARQDREDLIKSVTTFGQNFQTNVKGLNELQKEKFGELIATQHAMVGNTEQKLETMRATHETKLDVLTNKIENSLSAMADRFEKGARENREELSKSVKSFSDNLQTTMQNFTATQTQKLQEVISRQDTLVAHTETKLEYMRTTLESKLRQIQDDNTEKLEKMRQTVDEKLHKTLEDRLGESFKIVSERLELVHKGLGEMQTLATGVGDLKRVLSNVKTRGVLGEYQLGNILEQILTPDQYGKNVKTRKDSEGYVEFAVKIPGKDEANSTIWLPIDSKFPMEDYQELLDAYENADTARIETCHRQLINRIKASAREIRQKYVDPPYTTDFAIMFLPIEGLYAEVLRFPGLVEILQREFKVVITGPTTLSALLNSLQMGFRTLAIEKRSSEVWEILGAVKSEFGKFGDILDKTKKKLHEVSRTIEQAGTRSRAIERKLRNVQELPSSDSVKLIADINDEAPLGIPEELMPPQTDDE